MHGTSRAEPGWAGGGVRDLDLILSFHFGWLNQPWKVLSRATQESSLESALWATQLEGWRVGFLFGVYICRARGLGEAQVKAFYTTLIYSVVLH